jgi:aspartate/methionine/tyrosine aminotransferase
MFSDRLPPHAETNRLTQAIAALRARRAPFTDLTASNPTQAGIPYPGDLLTALADSRALVYEPDPRGLAAARAAVAADHARRGAVVDATHVVLTASTSEAYTWLFKLLCNPGDSVLVPRPSYPLFEHLTRLEGVRAVPYDLEYHGRWEVDVASLAAAPADARALLVVSPNNPTGSYVSARELEQLTAFCRGRGCALVADEVFADYALDAVHPVTDLATRAGVLAFTLGGLSKSLGLPQLKLGWMVVGGPPDDRDRALDALELIADSFLSVGTPVQVAAPTLLTRAAPVRAAIHARVRRNLDAARAAVAREPACELLRTEAGWAAVLRIPATRGEETFVLDLLERERILVHPGYFFDFRAEAFVVVSLLPPEDLFADAITRLVDAAVS